MKTFFYKNAKWLFRCSGILAGVGAAACGLWLLSADAKELVPLKGSLEMKVVESNTDPETLITTQVLEGQGNVTHMGLVSVWVKIKLEDVGLIDHDTFGPSWVVHLWGKEVETAANGDQLFADLDGYYIIPLPQPESFIAHIIVTGEVTGGTERFEGASGSMTLKGTDTTFVALEKDGVLSSVGSNKK